LPDSSAPSRGCVPGESLAASKEIGCLAGASGASAPASLGMTEASAAARHPCGFQFHVAEPSSHEYGSDEQYPPFPVAHHPHPGTGVHDPQVVYCPHEYADWCAGP
jgi:hypothetical protein